MPEIFNRFEKDTARTGHSALQAMKDFKEEIGDCWTPSKYAMAGLTIVGLTQNKESPMAVQIEELLVAADSRSDDIDKMVLQVQKTGLFERVEGCSDFDAYDSSVIKSDMLWDKTVQLIEAYFEGAADKQGDIRGAERILSELRQGDMTVQEYVSSFTILVRKLLRAGGSITDQRMIQLCLQGSGSVARDGFNDYVKQVKLNGKYTGEEYMQWSAFSSVMGRIGMLSAGSGDDDEDQQIPAQEKSVGMHVMQNNSAGFQAAVDAAVKAALAAGSRDKGRNAACNNWDYTGSCSYGDRCKFSHDTEPGCKGTNAGAQAEAKADADKLKENDKLKEERLLEGGKKECNNCIYEGCEGCGQKYAGGAAKALVPGARAPGMHAIGWKQQLQLTRGQPGMNWAQVAAPDEN